MVPTCKSILYCGLFQLSRCAHAAFEAYLILICRYVGDSVGNIKVLKIDLGVGHVVQMKYTIPFSASHGKEY